MIVKMLELSLEHLTEETNNWLAAEALQLAGHLTSSSIIVYEKSVYGWFICVPERLTDEDKETTPEDLVEIMEIAQKEKCDWIMFDADVAPIDTLPIYLW